MSTGIIELNDAGVRVSRATPSESGQDSALNSMENSEYSESPGVAVVNSKDLLLGEAALRQARLQPTQTNTFFWHRLSAEPLPLHNEQYRHHADLAYSHLLSLHESIADCEDVVFALPGSFTRQQMSLLLGIVGQCPFDVAGLVDSAVAAGSAFANAKNVLHLDLQLHQCIFTRLRGDGQLRREQVDVLPHCGLLTIRDRLAKVVSDQFIDQSRFDPLHSARTEQSLYDRLPHWLAQFREDSELFLEVADKQAKVAKQHLVIALEDIFQQIVSKAQQMGAADSQVLIGDRLAAVPGLVEFVSKRLPGATATQALPAQAVMTGIHNNLDAIRKPGEQITFVQALPMAAPLASTRTTTQENANGPEPEGELHVLLGNRALPLGDTTLLLDLVQGRVVQRESESHCSIRRTGKQLLLMPHNDAHVLVNSEGAAERSATDNLLLSCGDTVHLANSRQGARVIEVVASNGT